MQLEPGDLLVAYSDGVTEARNPGGEELGEERLLDCVRANYDLVPAELLQSVFSTVNEFSAGAAQGDDVTLWCCGSRVVNSWITNKLRRHDWLEQLDAPPGGAVRVGGRVAAESRAAGQRVGAG